ncbi:MAG: hypothetical protein GC201_01585 [Alphaproteobacteria bacterium]|nr:hypothetical protein [Alphaproteobacteria bacterium]
MPYRPDGDFLPDDQLSPRWNADPEEPEGGAWWKWAVAVASLAIFAGVVWYAYSSGTRGADGPVRTVEAPSQPYKLKPDDPGGLVIPDQDKLVFNEAVGRPEQEEDVLAPPPEAPQSKPEPIPVRRFVPPAAKAKAAEATAAAATEQAAAPPEKAAPSQPAPATPQPVQQAQLADRPGQETAAPASAQKSSGLVDRPGQEGSAGAARPSGPADRPGQEAAAAAARPSGLVDRPGQQEGGNSLALPPPGAGQPAPERDLSTMTRGETPPWETGADAGPAAQARPEPAAATATGGPVVQLGAYSSYDSAMQSWAEFHRRYASVAGAAEPMVTKVDIPGKGVLYKLQIGPYADKDAATTLCGQLKAQGRDCIVHAH